MIKQTLILVTILIAATSYSQCLSGDCENGYRKMQYNDGTFEGFFKNNQPYKLGVTQYANGTNYFGQVLNGKYNGLGQIYYKDGQNYVGNWSIGVQNGLGIYTDANQNPTAGIWENGTFKTAENTDVQTDNPPNCIGNCINGYGRITHTNGLIIQAVFKNGIATYGRIANTLYTYDGQIKDNLPNGYGQMSYTNADHYFGFFKDGKKHGNGIFTPKDKPKIYGEWVNDNFIDPNKAGYNEAEFCNQLTDLAKLTKQERQDKKVKLSSNIENKIFEQKFLDLFEIHYSPGVSFGDYITIIITKTTPNNSNISLQQIKSSLWNCKPFKTLRNSYSYNYTNTSIRLEDAGTNIKIIISFPKEN